MYKEHLFDVFKIIITLAFCGLFMGMLFKFQTDLMKTKFMFVMQNAIIYYFRKAWAY